MRYTVFVYLQNIPCFRLAELEAHESIQEQDHCGLETACQVHSGGHQIKARTKYGDRTRRIYKLLQQRRNFSQPLVEIIQAKPKIIKPSKLTPNLPFCFCSFHPLRPHVVLPDPAGTKGCILLVWLLVDHPVTPFVHHFQGLSFRDLEPLPMLRGSHVQLRLTRPLFSFCHRKNMMLFANIAAEYSLFVVQLCMYDLLYDPTEPEGFIVLVCNMDRFEFASSFPLFDTNVWCPDG